MSEFGRAVAQSMTTTPEPKRIDYDRMRREFPKQKAALTRAINTGDPDKVLAICRKTVRAWDEIGAWPDDWSRWQRALDDVAVKNGYYHGPRLEEI